MLKTFKLTNGITVLTDRMTNIRSVAFGVWVKTGSRNETKLQNGVSHFLEHMLFKGTETRTSKTIAEQMDAIGGQLNAYTTKEYTCYYARVLDTHIKTALDVLSDMIIRPLLSQEDTAKERNVIIEEINMYEDSPEDLVHDFLDYNMFAGASLGYPVIGTKTSVKSLSAKKLRAYFEEYYTNDNLILSVAGSFDENELKDLLEQYFGINKRNSVTNKTVETPSCSSLRTSKQKDTEQVHLCVGFPAGKSTPHNAFPLAALVSVMGGGMSSRLFQAIREERGLSYSIYAYTNSYTDCGVLSVYTALAPNQVNEVYELIIKEIKRFFTEKLTAEQLGKTKEQIKSVHIMGLESTQGRMSIMGRRMLSWGCVPEPDEIIAKIDAITLDSIYNLAECIFNFDKMSVCAVGNVRELRKQGFFKN